METSDSDSLSHRCGEEGGHMKSITYGEVSYGRMCSLIRKYIEEGRGNPVRITVGTDSQNFDITKVVLVVAVWRIGRGGIFFYDIRRTKKISNIEQKILFETGISLEMARKLSDDLTDAGMNCDIDIHVDAGYEGPSSKMIPEIVGWVKSCGFDCKIKPDSYAASSIADKYSK
jgi:hypothetical protein